MVLIERSNLRKRTPNWPVVPSKKKKKGSNIYQVLMGELILLGI